jgi:hypothetical protein
MAIYEWDGVVVDDGDARRRGHRISWCPKRGVAFYIDSGSPTPEFGGEERPCLECGMLPTPEGHDACLGTIPGAKGACCGHGLRQGYVLYPDGRREEPTPWRWARERLVTLTADETSRCSLGNARGHPAISSLATAQTADADAPAIRG